MKVEDNKLAPTPCVCNAGRQASRAVSRLYDEELSGIGLRTAECSQLGVLARAGQELLPAGTWQSLLSVLPEVARLTAGA
jgi:hypothetical protein